ncbi:protein THALLO [Physcomitrium patens]|uniref:Sas10 C-terminal domain-containing protein n=1 Tax=Physcomitrium patens TaxID=3218 RepID=A0A2K1JMW7_PHYPA|nr:something about silencing protein 10-like [Physcomitrium patens]PNR42884.1 hypothetical protein PHYPA_017716 [Physcomitrium patens]|eukprot:XP_024392747.1 something about silencing protein 10-like [Physcomitrella patens]
MKKEKMERLTKLQEMQEEESEDGEMQGSDDEDMDEEELTGLAAKMARQAKFMKQRVGMEDDEDDEEEEEKKSAVWGKGKKIYYGADNVDYELQSSDEEAPAEEEEAMKQLQKEIAAKMRPEDYNDDDSDEEGIEGEESFEDAAKKESQPKKKNKVVDKMVTDGTIELKKDIAALSKEEQMEVLMSDAPELVGLTTELQDNLNELRTKVAPLLEKVRGRKGATEEGLNYLELKHMLLLSYCQAIVFYLLLKAEGQSVKDHPVVGRLVDLKLSLERLRPIEEKLQKQIEKLLNSDLIEADEEETEANEKRENSKASKKASSEGKSKNRKAAIEETGNGTNGHVEEADNMLGIVSKQMLEERSRLDARTQEGRHVAHVPVSNAERKKAKRLKASTGMTGTGDDFEDVVDNDSGVSNGLLNAKPRSLSQVIAQAGRPFKKPQIISGDADLPVREELGDRRRKLEIQKTNKKIAMHDSDDHESNGRASSIEPEEDEFYKQAKLLKEAKQAAKDSKYSRTLLVPVEEEDAEGKRSITWQMEKNRGLTPHRKKANKNPRKKYKLKHEKAVIRRKGQVREMRQATSNYGGESTGIRTNISRSVRFKN